jgi:hypothetical protein
MVVHQVIQRRVNSGGNWSTDSVFLGKVAHFESESVAHFTTECLVRFAPEKVVHLAAESVVGCHRNPQKIRLLRKNYQLLST